MDKLVIVPSAEQVRSTLAANWPHPSFIGRFLPENRDITAENFTADWNISRFASNIDSTLASCAAGNCTALLANNFGVSLVDPVDVYFKSERATKYGILFLGLTFTYFFLFEVMKGARIHPVQYLLVGLSLAVFYLLLIALAEHIPFLTAYLIAAAVCVTLIASYVRHALGDRLQGLLVAGAGALLYGVLYVIIGAEDYALLMGSTLVFTSLALAMSLTRRLDWYGLGPLKPSPTAKADSAS